MKRLKDERGIALVAAVLIMAIISIAASSAIIFTTGTQKDGAAKKSGLTAYSLAQAALSTATEAITSHYYDSTGQPHDNTTALSSTGMATWASSGSQQSPSNSAGCTSNPISTCMTWTSVLECPLGVTCSAGAPTFTQVGVTKALWHITGTGSVPNPSAGGSLTRTITIDIPVNAPPGKTSSVSNIYNAVYSGGTGNPCDMNMSQGVQFVAPVYVVGNLCINNPQAGVSYPGILHVGGYLYLKNGNVGSTTNPLTDLEVGGACNGTQSMTPICTLFKPAPPPTVNYYTDSSRDIFANPTATNSPTFPDAPTEDFTSRATESSPYTCTGVETMGTSPFDLGPSNGDYSCTAPSGSISWNHSTKVLTISGNVYVYGNLTTANTEVIKPTGIGGIFVGGTASFGNNTQICVNGPSGSHDCSGGSSWDTTNNFLMIFAKSTISGSNLGLQGGLYSLANIDFGSGQTDIYGPLIGMTVLVPGQQAATTMPTIPTVITTWPNTPQPFWTLGAPENGTY